MRSLVYNKPRELVLELELESESESLEWELDGGQGHSHSRHPLTPTWQRFDGQLTDNQSTAEAMMAPARFDSRCLRRRRCHNYGATTMRGTWGQAQKLAGK